MSSFEMNWISYTFVGEKAWLLSVNHELSWSLTITNQALKIMFYTSYCIFKYELLNGIWMIKHRVSLFRFFKPYQFLIYPQGKARPTQWVGTRIKPKLVFEIGTVGGSEGTVVIVVKHLELPLLEYIGIVVVAVQ